MAKGTKMTRQMRAEIKRIARLCVDEMGDIFWDRESYRDAVHYADPLRTARASVEKALVEFAEKRGVH
jgi:hypothetical protein